MISRRNFGLGAALAAAAVAVPGIASAQNAAKTKLAIPYAAGGPVDLTTRIIADFIGGIQVENWTMGDAIVGTTRMARGPKDGSVIGLAATATFAINPWLYRRLPYHAQNDFIPISQLVSVPNVLVINADRAKSLNIKTFKDLVTYAQSNPNALKFGSGGNGSAGHLSGELLAERASVKIKHVPLKGGKAAQEALLKGDVDFNIDNLAAASANIKSGKLLALAVTSPQESRFLPGVPPIAASFSGFAIETWWGIVAPKGTPDHVIASLNKKFNDALNDPVVKSQMESFFADTKPGSPKDFGDYIEEETRKYRPLVAASGATVD